MTSQPVKVEDVSWATFDDEEIGFHMAVPVMMKNQKVAGLRALLVDQERQLAVNIVSEKMPTGMSFAEYVQHSLPTLMKMFMIDNFEQNEDITIGNDEHHVAGHKLRYNVNGAETLQVYFPQGSLAIVVTFQSPLESFTACQALFDHMVKSIVVSALSVPKSVKTDLQVTIAEIGFALKLASSWQPTDLPSPGSTTQPTPTPALKLTTPNVKVFSVGDDVFECKLLVTKSTLAQVIGDYKTLQYQPSQHQDMAKPLAKFEALVMEAKGDGVDDRLACLMSSNGCVYQLLLRDVSKNQTALPLGAMSTLLATVVITSATVSDQFVPSASSSTSPSTSSSTSSSSSSSQPLPSPSPSQFPTKYTFTAEDSRYAVDFQLPWHSLGATLNSANGSIMRIVKRSSSGVVSAIVIVVEPPPPQEELNKGNLLDEYVQLSCAQLQAAMSVDIVETQMKSQLVQLGGHSTAHVDYVNNTLGTQAMVFLSIIDPHCYAITIQPDKMVSKQELEQMRKEAIEILKTFRIT